MTNFSQIAIIYNPKSTGSSRQMAKRLLKLVQDRLPDQPVKLVKTAHAGHAETLAFELANKYDNPLILSSSGDGGYHEVVNGIMRAKSYGRNAIAGLIPAGNANDHFHATQRHKLIDCIVEKSIKSVDLLILEGLAEGSPVKRFGHSYIGFGITPKVGKKLNKTKLNAINQYLIAVRILFNSKAINLKIDNQTESFDSLIFSNIDRMSRVLTLSRDARIDDGKFEITAIHERSKSELVQIIFKAASIGLDESWQADEFDFQTIGAIDAQIDGEIYRLDKDSSVKIHIDKQSLQRLM